jgi:hypothetical protein
MSEPQNHNEDTMLLRLIELEEAKLRTNGAAPLAAEKINAVMDRLLAEKETILAGFDSQPALLVRKKSSTAKIWGSIGIAAMLVLGVGITYFLKISNAVEGRVVTAKGALKKNNQTLQPGAVLAKGDTIATEAKALAVLGWGKSATTLLSQNTRVNVVKLEKQDRPLIEIENTNGLTFTSVEKGRVDFIVRTPTAVCGVRGTSFNVNVTSDGTVVTVLDGVVETRLNEKFLETIPDAAQREKLAQPIQVNPKQKILISRANHSAVVSELSEAEVRYLTKLEKIAALGREKSDGGDTQRGAAIDKEADTLAAEVFAAEVNPTASGADGKAPAMTLADIRKKYGKVSRVNLKTGTSYTGYFKLKGAQMEIVTTRGVVRVPTTQLKDVQDIN